MIVRWSVIWKKIPCSGVNLISSLIGANQSKSFSHYQDSVLNKIPWKQAFLWIVVNSFNFSEFHAISTGLHYTAWHFLPPQLSCIGAQHSVTLPPLAQWPDTSASLTQVAREKRAIIQQTVPVLLTELLFITRARYSIREGKMARTIVGEVLGKLCLRADGSLLKRSEPGDQLSSMLKAPACMWVPHSPLTLLRQ